MKDHEPQALSRCWNRRKALYAVHEVVVRRGGRGEKRDPRVIDQNKSIYILLSKVYELGNIIIIRGIKGDNLSSLRSYLLISLASSFLYNIFWLTLE